MFNHEQYRLQAILILRSVLKGKWIKVQTPKLKWLAIYGLWAFENSTEEAEVIVTMEIIVEMKLGLVEMGGGG